MKRLLIISLCYLISLSANTQIIHTITSAGTTFSPLLLTVDKGDIVAFAVGTSHPVLQVSESTWGINGSAALQGGFSFPSGSGNYTANTLGTFYYICLAHIDAGMKGRIFVQEGTTGFKTLEIDKEIRIYPNPAKEYITIQYYGNSSIQAIRIVDLSGRTIKNYQDQDLLKENINLDINNLRKGLYFISVISGKEKYMGKFMKL